MAVQYHDTDSHPELLIYCDSFQKVYNFQPN